ncbi:MAG: thioredoxin fold domain-containing protein [Burkholderiales bacterium]
MIVRAGLVAAMLALGFVSPSQSTEGLVLATDLARDVRDAQANGRALIVFYTSPGCPWCERARREYLLPMQRNPELAARMVVREVDLASGAKLIDPSGAATTHRDFGRINRIRMTPTTVFLGADGKAIGKPIVGYSADFYGAYIEAGIEAARVRSERPADRGRNSG